MEQRKKNYFKKIVRPKEIRQLVSWLPDKTERRVMREIKSGKEVFAYFLKSECGLLLRSLFITKQKQRGRLSDEVIGSIARFSCWPLHQPPLTTFSGRNKRSRRRRTNSSSAQRLTGEANARFLMSLSSFLLFSTGWGLARVAARWRCRNAVCLFFFFYIILFILQNVAFLNSYYLFMLLFFLLAPFLQFYSFLEASPKCCNPGRLLGFLLLRAYYNKTLSESTTTTSSGPHVLRIRNKKN